MYILLKRENNNNTITCAHDVAKFMCKFVWKCCILSRYINYSKVNKIKTI